MPRFAVEVPDRRYFERLISCRERCPVHTDARGYVQAAARGDWALAYRIARGPNPFASICGRVCGAPCERACRRGAIDEPVSIRALKRVATERCGVEAGDPKAALAFSTAPGSVAPAMRAERVAVVGAGVAGLTCAHDLARLGYRVTVFEENAVPGGMLRTGVPLFRLPREVVEREIASILALGVELRCGVRVGSTVTLPELRAQGFAAVMLAVGLQKARMLDLPGAGLAGVVGGLDFLKAFNARKPLPPMGRVVVIGGGNVAYDCARSARRTPGTTSVTVTSLEALHEMPADAVEIAEGDEEGLARKNRFGPVRFVEGPDGRLAGVEVRAVSRVFDEKGRFAPELVPGTEEVVPCDTALVAVGQAGDTGFVTGLPGLALGRGGTVIADRETGRTSIPWLFAAGDASLGPGLFVDAIAQASRAARAIHAFVQGGAPEEVEPARAFEVEPVRHRMRRDWLDLPRFGPPVAEPGARLAGADVPVERSYEEEVAVLQGARCLHCEVETVFDGSLCIQCGGCADVCPTWCLRLVSLGEIGFAPPDGAAMSAIIKDEERCIRCGFCAERCPTDAIAMERLCGFEPWEPIPAAGGAA
jgi:NADPH-dependent glutamate synthase beta subunit-like oxidoreductase/NAD-dependent dihydropyrimidine dehydrogenase PreA subunit